MPRDNVNYSSAERALEGVCFYTDINSITTVYAVVDKGSHKETYSISDTRFKALIAERYRKIERLAYATNLSSIIEAHANSAIVDDTSRRFFSVRLASTKNYIEIFLGDSKWQRIIVDKDGWCIKNDGKYTFLKPNSTKEQCIPYKFGNYGLIDKYINMDKDSKTLFKIHLAQMFFDCSTHLATIFSSSKGTGKSTICKLIREIVDPSVAPLVSTPSNMGDFQNLLSNNKVVVLDNTETFETAVSNLLAGAITGTSYSKRKLYTDLDEVIVNLKSNVIINGIDVIAPKSDLLERSLFFQLNPISNEERRTDTSFWSDFNKEKPVILGGLMDVLSKAISLRPKVKLENYHRMADAYEDMAAISLAMGVELDEFKRIFDENIRNIQVRYAETNCVIEAINTWMDANGRTIIVDSAANIFRNLKGSCYGSSNEFPKSPSALSRYLNQEIESLASVGLSFVKRKKHDYTEITISRNGKGNTDGRVANRKRIISSAKDELQSDIDFD